MLTPELHFNSISVLFGLARVRTVLMNRTMNRAIQEFVGCYPNHFFRYLHAIANLYRLRVMQFIIFQQQLRFVSVQQTDWAASSRTLLRSRRRMS